MTKTMKMFLQLRDTGVAVNLQNLDELYEREFEDRLESSFSASRYEFEMLKKEILSVTVPSFDDKQRRETIEYCFGRVDSALQRKMRTK